MVGVSSCEGVWVSGGGLVGDWAAMSVCASLQIQKVG